MSEKIINPKPPTKTDLQILAYMDKGNFIDDEKGRLLFKCFGLRDSIYRLRKAGYDIKDKWVTSQITNKTYKNWFTKEMKIIPNGQITESTNSIPKEKKENTIVKPLELFAD